MIFDVHVHVGYFPRKDGRGGEAYYYSPARVMRYLHWVGVTEFIFSSTNSCWDTHGEAMHLEAAEVLRLARLQKKAAHPFFWVTREYLEWDAAFKRLPDFYEGIKLHGARDHWASHPRELRRVLAFASERKMPVQIHTSNDAINGAEVYLPYCRNFPAVHFDFAHCHTLEGMYHAMRECPNIYGDISFASEADIQKLFAHFPDRLMYGSDFPAPLFFWNASCTVYMRQHIRMAQRIGQEGLLFQNARKFIGEGQ